MATPFTIIETYFLAQVADLAKWEDRFDLLVEEIIGELGPNFRWSENATSADVDIAYVLYPPSHHLRAIEEEALKNYILSRTGGLSNVHVFAIGRNPKGIKVDVVDVMEIVDKQCTPFGVKGEAFRILHPEDLDDHVKKSLGRVHARRQVGVQGPADDATFAPHFGVTKRTNPSHPVYESSDL